MSTGILIDSCLIIQHMRDKDKSKTAFTRIVDGYDELFISTVIEYEVAVGKNVVHEELWSDILRKVSILPFDSPAVAAACEIKRMLLRKQKQIDLADLFIAATAVANGLPLATLNRKHFEWIDGLKLVLPK